MFRSYRPASCDEGIGAVWTWFLLWGLDPFAFGEDRAGRRRVEASKRKNID
jgi:hypothetical protein